MSLRLTYEDVYVKVAEYYGIGSSPTGTDLTLVKDITKRGYRRFLMPIDSSNGKLHTWKILEQTSTLSTIANIDTYDLPAGFSSFVTPLTYTTPISANPIEVALSVILHKKSVQTGTGYPYYFAVKNADFDPVKGQRYQVVLWPTPSSVLNYYFTYVFMPPEPTNADDYFIGDALAAEAILESCLAVAEKEKYTSPNSPNPEIHAKEADRLLQACIGKDKRDRMVRNMGQMTDGVIGKYPRSPIIYDADGNQIIPEL